MYSCQVLDKNVRNINFCLYRLSIFCQLMLYGHAKKKVALRDIVKIEKLRIFVLFENEASYKDFFCPQVF